MNTANQMYLNAYPFAHNRLLLNDIFKKRIHFSVVVIIVVFVVVVKFKPLLFFFF